MTRIGHFLGVFLVVCLASSCTTAPHGGGGTAQVNFQSPEEFTDMTQSPLTERGADPGYLEEFRQHIEKAAARRLPAGSTLALTITDVDMAGRFEPERGPDLDDVRMIKAIYPPRINVTFRLTGADGAVWAEGSRQLTDQAFDWRVSPVAHNDPLRHEKALIDDFLSELARTAR